MLSDATWCGAMVMGSMSLLKVSLVTPRNTGCTTAS